MSRDDPNSVFDADVYKFPQISANIHTYSLWHSVSAGCRSSCYFPGREKKQTAVTFKGKDWKRKAFLRLLKRCAAEVMETSCRANRSILTLCYPKIDGKNWGVCAAKEISLQHCGGVYSNVLVQSIMLGYIKGSTRLCRFKLMMLIRLPQ